MVNKNTEYEKLVQNVYESINRQEQVKNIKVEHDVKVKGSSGCHHQMDVYWQFSNMGVNHRVTIECKNYRSPISIGKVRDFHSALSDIGNVSGIMITKTGYQSGAEEFAKSKGIDLYMLREPTEEDWKGKIKNIQIDMHLITIEVKERKFNIDEEWVNKQPEFKNGLKIKMELNEDEIIIEENGLTQSVYELKNKLERNVIGENLEQIYEFENAFLITPNNPNIKIKSIGFIYDVVEGIETLNIEGDKIISHILKNVFSGEIKTIKNIDLNKKYQVD